MSPVPRLTLHILAIAMLGALSACSIVQRMLPGQQEARARTQQIEVLQLKVMRFADEYAGRTREALNGFQAVARTPEERLAAQNWKLQQSDAAYTIASGPNGLSNALDLIVLATLSRMVLDDVWVSESYGERARPVQESHRALEVEAWRLAEGLLNDVQLSQLHGIVDRWRSEHPKVRAVANVRFRDFARAAGSPGPGEEQKPGNLFSLLGLDPFTQLDPAVREITQTRELAERSIYYMQRVPDLLNMQVERLTYQFAVLPETRTLLESLNQVSLVGGAADRISRTFPEVLARERDALLSQLMRELNDRRTLVSSLSAEVRATLQAGTETTKALHDTLETADRISARFAPPPGAARPVEDAPPFDIRQYTEMVRELSATVRELNALASRVDSTLPAVQTMAASTAEGLNGAINHLFLMLTIYTVIAIGCVLGAKLAFRALAARISPRVAN